jgi:L-iditol 2-dehydrogenase
LIPVAENVPFRASAMLEPISVALHAVKRANIQKGDAVGIIGTGMIGFVAAQWAKTFGASQVDIIGRNEGKRALAENVPGIGYKLEKELASDSYDVVIEAVGTEDAINRSLTVTKAGGTLVLMGNPAGDIQLEQNTYWRILRKQLTVTGTWNSSYESGAICDWTEAAEALATGSLQVWPLISHVFSQKHAHHRENRQRADSKQGDQAFLARLS